MLVKGWMTSDVITIDEDTSMMKASQIMKENNIRRLPVMHKGKLIGMVTDRDIKEASPSKATTLDIHELYYLLSELKIKDIIEEDGIITIIPFDLKTRGLLIGRNASILKNNELIIKRHFEIKELKVGKENEQ